MDARTVEVLQRHAGYLCLRFPPPLNNAEFGRALDAGIKALAGIIQIAWVSAEGKLLVRFDPDACTHGDIARCVKSLLPESLPAESAPASPVAPAGETPPPTSIAERLGDLRNRAIAAAPERFRPMVESATTEKAVTNFINDIVAFYLIRTHWDLITRLWIKNPVKYGNAWLTVFYLVFLLVRYRKS
jgi:hypothetical protein